MNEGKIRWCLEQNKGIRLTEPKPHLSESYIREADETLENVFSARGKWKVIMAYYACYNALYAILMKCGIKCEIHDCTLELMGLFGFSPSETEFLIKLKDDRIRAQYYLKEVKLDDENAVKSFILRCKTILRSLSSEDIEKARKLIKKAR